jgi:hypothetical protein
MFVGPGMDRNWRPLLTVIVASSLSEVRRVA